MWRNVEVATREIDNLLADITMLRLLTEKRLIETKCVSFTEHCVWIQTLPMVGMSTEQEEQLLISLVLLKTDATCKPRANINVFFAVIH